MVKWEDSLPRVLRVLRFSVNGVKNNVKNVSGGKSCFQNIRPNPRGHS